MTNKMKKISHKVKSMHLVEKEDEPENAKNNEIYLDMNIRYDKKKAIKA